MKIYDGAQYAEPRVSASAMSAAGEAAQQHGLDGRKRQRWLARFSALAFPCVFGRILCQNLGVPQRIWGLILVQRCVDQTVTV